MAGRKSGGPKKSQSPSLPQEAYRRVCEGLRAHGVGRKKVYSEVARAMNALGYRNRKGAPLRATSIENLYYEVWRKNRGRARS